MKRLLVCALLASACGSVTDPSPTLDPAAQAVWERLMADLSTHGMSAADPSNTRGIRVQTETPMGDGEEIYYPAGGLVRGWTSNDGKEVHVYSGWESKPRGSRVLRHELAHAFCLRTIENGCVTGPGNLASSHHWPMPDGVDLWSVVD